jgi:hypothetical protein
MCSYRQIARNLLVNLSVVAHARDIPHLRLLGFSFAITQALNAVRCRKMLDGIEASLEMNWSEGRHLRNP